MDWTTGSIYVNLTFFPSKWDVNVRIIFIWKILENIVPNIGKPGIRDEISLRNGRTACIRNVNRIATTRVRRTQYADKSPQGVVYLNKSTIHWAPTGHPVSDLEYILFSFVQSEGSSLQNGSFKACYTWIVLEIWSTINWKKQFLIICEENGGFSKRWLKRLNAARSAENKTRCSQGCSVWGE